MNDVTGFTAPGYRRLPRELENQISNNAQLVNADLQRLSRRLQHE
jgi:hypothetical protein